MTTPNVDFDLYLPKTYVFKRADGTKYETETAMARLDSGGMQYIYLPIGMSMVNITATGMEGSILNVTLNQGNDYTKTLAVADRVTDATQRLWSGQLSNKGTNFSDGGIYLRIIAKYVSTAVMKRGSVSVQIVNLPPET